MTLHRKRLAVFALIAGLASAPVYTREAQTADDRVPSDLKSLLAPPQSEMRLVTLLYNTDRVTLNGNFDTGRLNARSSRGGPGGGGGGRDGGTGRQGGAAPGAAAAQQGQGQGRGNADTTQGAGLSTRRIARLKRFDMDWQASLGRMDSSKLSPAAKAELQALQATVAANLQQLDADAAAIAEVMPLLPFSTPLVDLSEARIRLDTVDARKSAGIVTKVTADITALAERLQKDPAAVPGVTTAIAVRAADSVDGLRGGMAAWFAFSDGYDPVFTWWMGVPYQKLDAALVSYAALLRDSWQPAASTAAPAAAAPIAPAAAPAIAEVPDLNAVLRLPQDEMIPVVQRFTGTSAGDRAATNSPGSGRPKEYYAAWLAALKTLDFDRLSRNAQVDYLFIRSASERYLARADQKLDPDPPRKTDRSGIQGAARGRDGLLQDLGDEMIPYTPEELIALAEKEFAYCEEEMKKASRAMGFGDDWKQAVEKVKGMHVEPGGQPAAIRDMLFEAVDYVRRNDLITVPEIASESLHMSMMTPEAQLQNPFFLGGSQILVSYPTNTMDDDARLQSMRGNNIPFSHATAFHEMIPGHNLVGYVNARHAGYRARIGGSTPFYTEGWPLYWELLMYERGFHDTPEEKVGALFWRMHRCARIIFSLKFHMGQWSPQECIDFLVDRVGHERDNATAEVRRSFQGGYGPLYQAGYLLGGLQLRALRRDLVDTRQLTDREFHDEILRQGNMPISLIRLAVSKQRLTRDMPVAWKFYGDDPAK
jgi:uncharacterized protein (DUF885 family)